MKTLSLEVSTYLKLCEAVDSPRSLACFMLAKAEQWLDVFSLPSPDKNRPGFREDYLVSEFLKKNVDLQLGIDRERVAIQKFLESEQQCKETNERFAAYSSGSVAAPRFLRDVRYWMHRILGSLSREKLEYVNDHCRFGPGATSVCRGAGVLPSIKYACDMHTTLRLRPLIRSLMGETWAQSPHGDILVLNESRVTTVPKNAKTDRTICVEAHGNVYVQLGIGRLLRRQLLRFGIDLDTQEWSRFLASQAWKWRLATIDLSMASDTVAYNVVKYVTPGNWFRLLDMARMDFTVVDSNVIQLEKFSSMGNGFTFELETLLFVACAMASGADRKLMSVYGDDIIVEQTVAPSLVENLSLLGFKVNVDKTFVDGDFYESCGSDFYRGEAVRPFYARGGYESLDECCFLLANNLRRWCATSFMGSVSHDKKYFPVWLHIVQRASKRAKLTKIPDGVGDDGFVRAFDEGGVPELTNGHSREGWFGYNGRCFTRKSKFSLRSSHTGGMLRSLTRRRYQKIPDRRPIVIWVSEIDISETDTWSFPEPIRGQTTLSDRLRDVSVWHWTGVGPWEG